MARTQLRLDSITGSIAAIDAAALGKAAPGSLAASDLEGVLGAFAGAVKRIHGQASGFTDQDPGRFSHAISSSVGGPGAIVFDAAATSQQIVKKGGGDFSIQVQGSNLFKTNVNGTDRLTVASAYASSSVDLVAGAELKALSAGGVASGLYFRGTDQTVKAASNAIWDGATNALKVTGEISGSGNFSVGGNVTLQGDIVADDTAELKQVFGTSTGNIQIGSISSTSTAVLQAASGSFSGDLTVTGNLNVLGSTTTVDTVDLVVEDNMILINKNEVGAGVTAGTSGIEIERGSADNAKIQWEEGADQFELKVGGAYADLQVLDFSAVDGTFSGELSGASLTGSNLANAEYVYADVNGSLLKGDFQFTPDDDIVVDTSTPGRVNFSLLFPISGSYASLVDAETALADGLDYIGTETSVIDALIALDQAVAGVASTVGASSKKATAKLGSDYSLTAGLTADMKSTLSDSSFISELTDANGMVFVNGQLLLSGSTSVGVSSEDYSTDGGNLVFTFALKADDVIVVQKA